MKNTKIGLKEILKRMYLDTGRQYYFEGSSEEWAEEEAEEFVQEYLDDILDILK